MKKRIAKKIFARNATTNNMPQLMRAARVLYRHRAITAVERFSATMTWWIRESVKFDVHIVPIDKDATFDGIDAVGKSDLSPDDLTLSGISSTCHVCSIRFV